MGLTAVNVIKFHWHSRDWIRKKTASDSPVLQSKQIINNALCLFIFSSPEHIELMVSYCYTLMSVICPSVKFSLKWLLNHLANLIKVGVDVSGIKLFDCLVDLFKSCSNYSPEVRIDPAPRGHWFSVYTYSENLKNILFQNHKG